MNTHQDNTPNQRKAQNDCKTPLPKRHKYCHIRIDTKMKQKCHRTNFDDFIIVPNHHVRCHPLSLSYIMIITMLMSFWINNMVSAFQQIPCINVGVNERSLLPSNVGCSLSHLQKLSERATRRTTIQSTTRSTESITRTRQRRND